MNKQWKKVYKYLDYEEYHLNRTMYEDGSESWKLYKKYDGFLTDNSRPIMNSKEYTMENLIKFLKEHRAIDLNLVVNAATFIVSNIILILCVLNILLWQNKQLSGILLGFITGITFLNIVISIAAMEQNKIKFKNRALNFIAKYSKGEEDESEL